MKKMNQRGIDKEVEKRGPIPMRPVANNAPGGVYGDENRDDSKIDGKADPEMRSLFGKLKDHHSNVKEG